ncbi:MAG TPA: hypothetical protein VLS90_15550, partial [Thermodesulfobacteriota bacterium]|nr:hypothetical protein [Thermodesulfobacteriota bacterium]
MLGQEKALKLLKMLVGRSSADQMEAILMTEDSSLTRFTPDSVHQHVAEVNETLILRVVLGKQIAVVTTNALDARTLKETLEDSMGLARLLPPKHDFVSLPGPRPIAPAKTFFENIRLLTPQKKVGIIRDLSKVVRESGCRVSGAFSHGTVEVSVANSLGVEAYQQYSDIFMHLILQSGADQDGGGSGYAAFASRDCGGFDWEPLAREAVSKARRGSPVS